MICKKCAKLSEKQQDAHRKSFYKEKQHVHIYFYRHQSLAQDPKLHRENRVLWMGSWAVRRQEQEGATTLQVLADLPTL